MNSTSKPRLTWSNVERQGTSKFYHARGVNTHHGIESLDRGGSPSVVLVVDRDDFRVKVFLETWPSGWDGRVVLPGRETILKRNKGSRGLWQARFDSYEDLAAACALTGTGVRKPPPSYEPTYERSDVAVPTGQGKLPRLFLQPDRAGEVYSVYRWVGRMPPQFHRRPLGRPVLEIRGEEIRAYGSHIDAVPWTIGGLTVSFTRDQGYTASDHDLFVSTEHPTDAVDREIINWVPPAKRWRPPELSEAQIELRIERLTEKRGTDYLDACVETVFRPNTRSDHLPWEGDTSHWPEWMEATGVTVTPASTGGGSHGVTFNAPGVRKRGYPPVRLNDVWLITGPYSGDRVWGTCDPLDLEEIRGFGQGLDPVESLPNEPIAVRNQRQLRAMHNLLASFNDGKYGPGLPGDTYGPWRDDLKTIETSSSFLCMMQGQADYNRDAEARCLAEARRLEGLVQSRFARRAPAYLDHTLEDWLAEVPDQRWVKPRAWTARAKEQRRYMVTAATRATDIELKIAEWRAKRDAALARCEQRDDEWADLVVVLHPA